MGWRLLAYSVASQTKGETVDEILGMFDAMHALTGATTWPRRPPGHGRVERRGSGGRKITSPR